MSHIQSPLSRCAVLTCLDGLLCSLVCWHKFCTKSDAVLVMRICKWYEMQDTALLLLFVENLYLQNWDGVCENRILRTWSRILCLRSLWFQCWMESI